MKNYLSILTEKERQSLYNAPVYVSLLGALEDGKITANEMKEATTLIHYRTFTSNPILQEYYKKAEDHFINTIEKEQIVLPKNAILAREVYHKKLEEVNTILSKVDAKFSNELKKSLYSFANHIANADNNWIQALSVLVDPFIDTPNLEVSDDLFKKED
jgi:hypothetical protein